MSPTTKINERAKYAEELNYWKTSQTSADSWIERIKKNIKTFGGRALAEGYGNEESTGRSALMLVFELDGDQFKIVWPVLPSRSGAHSAAKIQAATMMYHDIKARLLSATVLGARASFFNYLLLPDGRTAGQASVPELAGAVPDMMLANTPPRLTDGRHK